TRFYHQALLFRKIGSQHLQYLPCCSNRVSCQRSLCLNILIDNSKGSATHSNRMNNEKAVPLVLPRKSLKKAPVYPIRAEISSLSIISILARSTGLRDTMASVAFSRG